MDVEVTEASVADRPVLERLMQLYQYDFSELLGWHLDQDGTFAYRWWDAYWVEPERHAYLFRVDGAPAGFALVRDHGDEREIAEFFIVRAARRHGVGAAAANMVFAIWPGRWMLTQLPENANATAFWRAALPSGFTQAERPDGRVEQRFTV